MATHSSVLAWRIPGTAGPGGLLSWGRTESDMTDVTLQAYTKDFFCLWQLCPSEG